jgi:hypothetical protein
MSSGPTHIFVLAEDREQQKLVYGFLKCTRLERAARLEPLPNGRGSGEQFVRKLFPELRRKVESSLGRSVSAIGVVMIDADTSTVANRRAQLLGPHAPHHNSPGLAILIPRRNVETWLCALNGQTVDEIADYKGQCSDAAAIKDAAQALYDLTRHNVQIPQSCTQSLSASIPEWKKIG